MAFIDSDDLWFPEFLSTSLKNYWEPPKVLYFPPIKDVTKLL